MINKIDGKIRIKRSSVIGGTPSIGPTTDHTDGGWGVNDIYPGEYYFNEADNLLWIGGTNSVLQIGLGGSVGASNGLTKVGSDIQLGGTVVNDTSIALDDISLEITSMRDDTTSIYVESGKGTLHLGHKPGQTPTKVTGDIVALAHSGIQLTVPNTGPSTDSKIIIDDNGSGSLRGKDWDVESNTFRYVSLNLDDTLKGIDYPIDYTLGWDVTTPDTLLTTKGYVDREIASGGTTASNGLTKVVDDIQLGGILTQNTSINMGNFSMNIGGFGSSANGAGAVALGTLGSIVDGPQSVVLGGLGGWVDGSQSVILGGLGGSVSGNSSAVIGGGGTTPFNNSITGDSSVVLGGIDNVVVGNQSTIIGGTFNDVISSSSAIISGVSNTINGNSSVINGGGSNTINGTNSVINGGGTNVINAFDSGIVAGTNNIVTGDNSVVVGGYTNNTDSTNSSIVGGKHHTIVNSYSSVVVGGSYNNIGATAGAYGNSQNSVTSGGYRNDINGYSAMASITGGYYNTISGYCNSAAIVSGYQNTITNQSSLSTMIGGQYNEINQSQNSSIIGGYYNSIISLGQPIIGSIIGGKNNEMTGTVAAALRNFSTIIGGESNVIATSTSSAIIGGTNNEISLNTSRSVIIGGNAITATEDDTVYVPNLNVGTVQVFADNTAAAALSTGTVYRTATGVLMIKY